MKEEEPMNTTTEVVTFIISIAAVGYMLYLLF